MNTIRLLPLVFLWEGASRTKAKTLSRAIAYSLVLFRGNRAPAMDVSLHAMP